jgi:hypothetical protein
MNNIPCYIGVVILCIILGGESWACQCGDIPSQAEALEVSEAVFVGTALSSRKGSVDVDHGFWRGQVTVSFMEFRVISIQKGSLQSHVELVYDFSNCDFRFEIGKTYHVYAITDSQIKSNVLSASMCLPNRIYEH